MARRELKSWRHPDGVQLISWCPECSEYHLYGGPNWKSGKCVGREGYRMIIEGPVPEHILRDSRRRKPLGPAASEMLSRPRPRRQVEPDLIDVIMARLDRIEEHLEPSLETEQGLEVGA